jgi:hypothetical protein
LDSRRSALISRERCSMVSAQESGTWPPCSWSRRKRSPHTTSGRKISWSYSRITMNMVAIAQPIARSEPCSMASAM